MRKLGLALDGILAGALVIFAAYLLGSIVAWNLDPGHWDPFSRFVIAMVGGIGGTLSALAKYEDR